MNFLSTIPLQWYLAGFFSALFLGLLTYLAINKSTRPYVGGVMLVVSHLHMS